MQPKYELKSHYHSLKLVVNIIFAQILIVYGFK
jgi:hypothetical protein